jgi:trimeric autotransporter adhesin
MKKALFLFVCSLVLCQKLLAQGCGIIITVAGDSTAGYSGDGGAATAAELHSPYGVAFDAWGNLYVSDFYNNVIRKVAPSGTISTVAGGGTSGLGDGGAATAAALANPYGVAVDVAGNLHIGDYFNARIRKVTPSGTISTVVGNGTLGYAGDGGAATAAELDLPTGVAVDASGNLYIADALNAVIRKVAPSGTISTVAGTGTSGYSGDGGAATAAELDEPCGVAVDAAGNLYIADKNNNRIRKVTPSGTIGTAAGGGTSGLGDGGTATAAELFEPMGVAVDVSGNLYIADNGNDRIRKVTLSGTISTVAGNGTYGCSGDVGAATAAALAGPQEVAVDASGNLYIADVNNNRIRKVGTCNTFVPTAIATANHYTIYPNPTSSILNIEQSSPYDLQLPTTVINQLGQTVYSGEVAMQGGRGTLDVSNLVPGIYVVVFRKEDGGREQFKVVVE